MIKTIIDNAIIYGTLIGIFTTIILWIRWKYLDLRHQINYFIVRNKYYDIAFMSYLKCKPTESSFLLLSKNKECLFTDDEIKYLNWVLDEQDKLRKEINHRNL